MKVPVVNRDLCIGCGACQAICPDTFKLDESGKAQVITGRSCDGCNCEAVVTSCPVSAISLLDA
ncbi:MAG: ferredoxin [Candidatus Nezhaarchaeales archaeon]